MTLDTREMGKSRTTAGVRRPRTYGTVRSGGQRHDRAFAPRADDVLLQPIDKQPVADLKSFSILRRVVAASGVLGLFALSISVASSWRQAEPSRWRDPSDVDTEGFRVRKTFAFHRNRRHVGTLCSCRRVLCVVRGRASNLLLLFQSGRS